MKRNAFAVVIGAVVFYLWGMVFWMFIPLMESTISQLPEERLIRDTLKVTVAKPGIYSFPGMQTEDGKMSQEEWAKVYEKGPTGLIVYSPGGKPPISGENLLFSFLVALFSAIFAVVTLVSSKAALTSYASRVAAVTSLGGFAWVVVHVPYWNWFQFPAAYTGANLVYLLGAFGLLGLVTGKIVAR